MLFRHLQACCFLFLLLPHLIFAGTIIEIEGALKTENDRIFERAVEIQYNKPDSAAFLFEESCRNFLSLGDTSQAIITLSELADTYGHQANYKKSYDALWRALLLADASQNELAKAKTYVAIGRYYSFYKRTEEAIKYLQLALQIKKRLSNEGVIPRDQLTTNYYILCATYRELDQPDLAQVYLDTAFQLYSPKNSIELMKLKFEQAHLLFRDSHYHKSLEIFREVEPWFITTSPSYLVLLHTYMGDNLKSLGRFEESEQYYKSAIQASKDYKRHVDFTPIIFEKLSDLHAIKGDYASAYQDLRTKEELDGKFFDSRSENNRPLLEIQDAFRKEKEKQKQVLQEQLLSKLQQDEKILFLQRSILLITIFSILLIGVFLFNYIKSKHRTETELIKQRQELEIQKANEVVEMKNKELAISAMQLIERDEYLTNLKEKLLTPSGRLSTKGVKEVLRSISVSSAQNWEEFRTRFVAVNQSFYRRLNERFPHLSPGDQKLCALVKLNLSSKEMSKLLGISIESVHTNRYRLRKKLGIKRDTNLTEFIGSL